MKAKAKAKARPGAVKLTRPRTGRWRKGEEPYVENYPELSEWLKRHEARCMWQLPLGDSEMPTAFVECYLIGRRLLVVVVNARKHGWELYTALDSVLIDPTLIDAEKRLGLGS